MLKTILLILLVMACFWAGVRFAKSPSAEAQTGNRVFELRTYTTLPGRLDALNARFRNHTTRLFEKHGMTNVGYWVPKDEPRSQDTLIYIVAHKSRDAAAQSWQAFRSDPEWKKAQAESEASGKIVAKVESVFLDSTDYSKIK